MPHFVYSLYHFFLTARIGNNSIYKNSVKKTDVGWSDRWVEGWILSNYASSLPHGHAKRVQINTLFFPYTKLLSHSVRINELIYVKCSEHMQMMLLIISTLLFLTSSKPHWMLTTILLVEAPFKNSWRQHVNKIRPTGSSTGVIRSPGPHKNCLSIAHVALSA